MSVSNYILHFQDTAPEDHGRVGGKCASLAEMTCAGVRVPPGFAVTTDAHEAMLAAAGLKEDIGALLDELESDNVADEKRVAQAIRERIVSQELPADVEAAIRETYAQMGPNMAVAIRSSATAEDLPDASFAGQQDTYLWITDADDVVRKVRDCWASLFTARAVAYRVHNKISHVEVLMSVAVQKMVNASAAGVAMTLNPLDGDKTRIVTDSAYGLGEPIVSGEITPDHFVVEKVLMEIMDRKIVDKEYELVGDAEAGCVVERAVEDDRRGQPSLTDEQVLAVAQLAKQLERQNGCAQDVEWALDADLPTGDNLLALQSRPETVWSRKPKATGKDYGLGMEGLVNTLKSPLKNKNSKAIK